MPKKFITWECEGCGNWFLDEKEAEECEKSHPVSDNLKVIDVKFNSDKETGRFPWRILVEDEEFSGTLAEYEIKRVSSIETFYDVQEGTYDRGLSV